MKICRTGDHRAWTSVGLLSSIVTSLVFIVPGCQDSSRIAPVHGKVTLDGQPVPRGMVQFVPLQSATGELPTATGEIQADGSYRLQTDTEDGAIVGRHAVRIEARGIPTETDTLPAPIVPERYLSETTSQIEKEVAAGQANEIDLILTSP